MSDIKITGVRAIETAPQPGSNLIVVRIDTNQPGLYGLGCATFTQRHKAVVTAIREYMDQLLRGRDALDVEDAFYSGMHSSYWRNGPVLNNAISGCDIALWDILGKVAHLPVYRLLGGALRPSVPVYRHANGASCEELEDSVRAYMEQGYHYIRCQLGGYGGSTRRARKDGKVVMDAGRREFVIPDGAVPGNYFDPADYAASVPMFFDYLRSHIGFGVELLHDVHERVEPIAAVRLAKELEPYKLFFLEDPLAPEQQEWFRQIRSASATPIAMGELFNNPTEWMPLIEHRLIDFIRCHISQIGGITPARKLAQTCESFGIRTAWHGPGDVSPIGHAANLHLDMASHNFGIQEWCGMETDPRVQEVFSGMPYIKDGAAHLSEEPGIGVDIDEEAAKKYPCSSQQPAWLLSRLPDGTSCWA